MAAALRILGTNRFVLSSKKKPLTLSLSTMPGERILRSEKNGWEFCLRSLFPSDWGGRKTCSQIPAKFVNDRDLSIKHLDSGIKFSFNGYDAFRKFQQEKSVLNPFRTDLPSYGSPLLPVFDDQYDSAYVGYISIEKPGEEPRSIIPTWEYIDWKTLHKQIVWTTKNEQVRSVPLLISYFNNNGSLSFTRQEKKGKKSNGKGPLDTLVHFQMCSYYNTSIFGGCGKSSCNSNLVVTDFGWFFYLCQHYFNCYGDTRKREMTMHCNFKQNIIFREIIERQSKNFEKRHFQVHKKKQKPKDDEMRVHFHEVKQFNIQEAYMGEFSSCAARDARRYMSFTVDEWKKTSPVVDVSDDQVKSLFANYGRQIWSIEKRKGTRIQIVPLFRHPYNPKIFEVNGEPIPGKAPRTAYIHGVENHVVPAISWLPMMDMPDLTDLLAGTSQ